MGTGTVTFLNGQVFGGDNGYLYTGIYTAQGNTIAAKVHGRAFVPGTPNVMGRSEFDLELSGALNGNTMQASGSVPGTPFKLSGTLTKQRDIA